MVCVAAAVLRALLLVAVAVPAAWSATCIDAGCESCTDTGGDFDDASIFSPTPGMSSSQVMCTLDGTGAYTVTCPSGVTCVGLNLDIGGGNMGNVNPAHAITLRAATDSELHNLREVRLYGPNAHLELQPDSSYRLTDGVRFTHIEGGASATSVTGGGANVLQTMNIRVHDPDSSWTVTPHPTRPNDVQEWYNVGLDFEDGGVLDVTGNLFVRIWDSTRHARYGGEVRHRNGQFAFCWHRFSFNNGGIFRGTNGAWDGELCATGHGSDIVCQTGTEMYFENYDILRPAGLETVFYWNSGMCTIEWRGANTVTQRVAAGGQQKMTVHDDATVHFHNFDGNVLFNARGWIIGTNADVDMGTLDSNNGYMYWHGGNVVAPPYQFRLGSGSVLAIGRRFIFGERLDVILDPGSVVESKTTGTSTGTHCEIRYVDISGGPRFDRTGDTESFSFRVNSNVYFATDHTLIPDGEMNPQNFVTPTTWTINNFAAVNVDNNANLNFFIHGTEPGQYSVLDASMSDVLDFKAGSNINIYWKFSSTFPQAARKTRSIVIAIGPDIIDGVILATTDIVNNLGDYDDTLTAPPTVAIIDNRYLTVSLIGLDSGSPCPGECLCPDRCKVCPCQLPNSCQAEIPLVCDDGDPSTEDTCDSSIEFEDTCVYTERKNAGFDDQLAKLMMGLGAVGLIVMAIGGVIMAARNNRSNRKVLEAAQKILEEAKSDKSKDPYQGGGYGTASSNGSMAKPNYLADMDNYSVSSGGDDRDDAHDGRSIGRMTQASAVTQETDDMRSAVSGASFATKQSGISKFSRVSAITMEPPSAATGNQRRPSRNHRGGRRGTADRKRKPRSNTAPVARRR